MTLHDLQKFPESMILTNVPWRQAVDRRQGFAKLGVQLVAAISLAERCSPVGEARVWKWEGDGLCPHRLKTVRLVTSQGPCENEYSQGEYPSLMQELDCHLSNYIAKHKTQDWVAVEGLNLS